ncbi:MAG: RND transporter [Roseivivax sp.]|nr:RND transporter [Roseivivax sp.]
MSQLRALLSRLPLRILVIASLTLGLAPFFPEPHVWEKLKMLAAGDLSRPIDIFDLALHGAPWVLLGLKLALGQPRQG